MMAKPDSAPPAKVYDIPTVSFRIITDDKSLVGPAGVHSEQARSYGYNDFSDYERPEHYIRYIEPIESELAVQVEYDMDEQDQEWLDAINAERKKDQTGPITYEVFEIIMDKLEKEWFNLIKRVPQPAANMPVEDSKCAICDDGEGENSNAIVFCDGCNLAVHQDCYGVPYIPEGQWLCRKCTVSPENPVSCLFCPNEGGAFKQTNTGHWSHLLCAIWIPELSVGNAIYMEPVEGVELIPKQRWKLNCSLCKERGIGACIQCENKSCFTAFHVTCARSAGLLMSMKLMGEDGQLKAYCDKHLPADWNSPVLEDDEEDDSYHEESDDSETVAPRLKQRKRKDSPPRAVTTKTARAHAKSYRPGPPIVPRMIVNRLLEYVGKVAIRKRQPFIERLCRYWSLKREARRGAPLLKRLHLEPWTATSESQELTDAEKAKKLEFLITLRNDLEKVRLLAELVRKREREKLRQAQVIKEIVDTFIFPHYITVRATLEKIVAMDKGELFLHPVDPEEVPDYAVVIKEPMTWTQMDEKLERALYRNIDEFKRDVHLVLDNAMLYNKGETPFHRTAARIKKNAQPLLDELDVIPPQSAQMPPLEDESASFVDPPENAFGNMETSLARLHTLFAPDSGEPDRDMLASIFVTEVGKPKEPTPPPSKAPTPPVTAQRTRKTLTAAERTQKFKDQQAQYEERVKAGSTRSRAAASGDAGTATPPLQELPMAGPSRRKSRRQGGIEEDGLLAEGEISAMSSPGGIKPQAKPQPGVFGVQSVPVISDRERREREKQLELVTDRIDQSDEYKRFNVGWILPEGSKRSRPTKPLPPPKTEPRRASSVSDRSSHSVARSKLPKTAVPQEVVEEEPEPEPVRPSRKRQAASPADAPTRTKRQRGTADEELPEQKAKPRKGKGKAEDVKMDVDDDEPLTPVVDSPASPPPVLEEEPAVKGSSLTPDPDTAEPQAAEVAEGSPTPSPSKARGHARAEHKDDAYPPGTQVWAKVASYPYFPAVIIDFVNDWETVPQSVLDLEEGAQVGGRAWLVRFYDKQKSYGWVHADKLAVLGNDQELDDMYLSGRDGPGRPGRFKSSHLKQACKKAYKEAQDAK